MKTKNLVALAASGGLVLTPLGLLPAPAQAAPGDGRFSVHVDDWVTHRSLPGMQVTLYDAATGGVVATTTTSTDDPATDEDETGRATFTGLGDGRFTAKVHDPAGKHVEKYTRVRTIDDDSYYSSTYDEVSLVPTTVEVGQLSGTVTQSTEGNGDLEAIVEVFPSTATEETIATGAVDPIATREVYDYDYGSGESTHSGDWSVKVPGGQAYKVRISDQDSRECEYVDYDYVCDYGTQVWIGVSGATADNAQAIAVAKGAKVATGARNLPVEAVGAVRIAGTVSGTGGIALDDVDVELFKRYEHDGAQTWIEVASTETGDDGAFGFDDGSTWVWDETDYYDYESGTYEGGWDEDDYGPLTAGTYTLRYTDERDEYATQFLGKKNPDPSQPEDVPTDVGTLQLSDTGVAPAGFAMTSSAPATTSGAYGVLSDDAGKPHPGRITFFDITGNEVWNTTTRRDGTFSAPTTSLPPGRYKIYADAFDDSAIDGWVGGAGFRQARILTVPVAGTVNAGGTALARPATLAGTISAPAITGTTDSYRWVTVTSTSGQTYERIPTAANGTFNVQLPPGSYYVAADGYAYSTFDSSDVGTSIVDYIEQFWKGSYRLPGATVVKVGSGGRVTGLNMALGNRLLATTAPRIGGTAKVGSTLTASLGAWNVADGVTLSVVWKRGSTVVSTKTSYKTVKADSNQVLTVVVTATDRSGTYATGTSSTTVKIPKVKKPRKGKGKRAVS